jgi:hypothetical protein
MRKNYNGWVLVGTLALLLAACGGAGPSDISAESAQTLSLSAATNVTGKPDAELTAKALDQAEIKAQQMDSSISLESQLPGSIAAKEAYVSGAVVQKAAAVASPAYRFFNASTGAHFYTIDAVERTNLQANLSSPFKFEGAAFSVGSSASAGLSPVHRFYNAQTGVHFYTISEAERVKTMATLPQFTYEGVAYYASQVAGTGLVPLYRFFLPSKGFHFYTASESEKASIQANQNGTYSYEGIAYYVLGGASTGSMPAVNSALIPLGLPGVSVEKITLTSERPAASDGTGAFRTVCDFSHMAFDDPIAYPGQPGRSHLHAFFGNTGANANSTAASIASSGNSTCRGGIVNRTSYWVPAMIDTRDGTPRKPSSSNFYYKTGYGGVVPSTVQAFPEGLRMIAGDMKNASPGGVNDAMPFGYSCNDGSMSGRSIPNCAVGNPVVQHIYFPQCWDGVNLDSPDHKSHMAYPTGGKGCPSSHPKALPEVTFNIVYEVTEANSPLRWRLSSDDYSSSLPGGYSGHGDWFNGWRPEIMDAFIKNCDRTALDCHSHLLGDGRALN